MEIQSVVSNLKARKYAGSNITDATLYHSLPFPGYEHIACHRQGTLERWQLIANNLDYKDKTMVDLGCSNGGISLLFAKNGAKQITGYDYDNDSLEVGRLVAKQLNIANVEFVHKTINLKFFSYLPYIDITVWMSHYMWIVKQYGILEAQNMLSMLSHKSNVLVFETATEKDGMAGNHMKGLTQDHIGNYLLKNTVYTNIKDIGFVKGWHNRHIFVCSK